MLIIKEHILLLAYENIQSLFKYMFKKYMLHKNIRKTIYILLYFLLT